MSTPVYAIECEAYDPVAAATVTLAFATYGFTTTPADTPANTHFEPRAIEAGTFSQFLVDALTTDGRSRVGTGAVVLANADGGLDALRGYGMYGRSLTIRRGRVGDPYPSGWTTLLTGTVEQAEFSLTQVRLRIRDRQAEVAHAAYQSTKFAGDNALPSGVEGVADDLKGKPKPILRGKARNIAPPCVNTSKLTYQVSHRQINSVDAVYVGGLALSAGTAHASLADLQAATVTAGQYDTYLGSGSDGAYFRLGTAPDNLVTCDATQGANAAARTAAQVAKQILLDAGVASGDISAASVTALDTANSAVLGYWTGTEERKVGEALDAVLGSVGGYWAVTADGTFAFGRLEAPAGTPAMTVTSAELLESGAEAVERLAGRAEDRGLPAWRINLRYQKNYTVQAGADVVAAVSQARRALLAEEWRTATADDAAVKTTHLLAPEKEAFSLIDAEADAQDEADRLLALYSEKRDFLRVRLPPDNAEALALELGDVVELDYARFDWGGGKPFVVTGLIYEFRLNQMTVELWG